MDVGDMRDPETVRRHRGASGHDDGSEAERPRFDLAPGDEEKTPPRNDAEKNPRRGTI